MADADGDGTGSGMDVSPRLQALLRYTGRLTREPAAIRESDIADLRQAGLSDRDIVDLNQVVSYYNYVNRVADGLGITLEADMAHRLDDVF